ncbi:MAG: hypothetical protein LBT82_03440 [Oscillospiraceae bacterium]|nr:hypothetical protein [Oscillospiraceae bacterium]
MKKNKKQQKNNKIKNSDLKSVGGGLSLKFDRNKKDMRFPKNHNGPLNHQHGFKNNRFDFNNVNRKSFFDKYQNDENI